MKPSINVQQASGPRLFPGQRWVNIALRCGHLVGVAGIGGGFLFGVEEARWLPFWYLTVGSGVLLVLLYLWSEAQWLCRLKGAIIVIKLVLLASTLLWPAWREALFILLILLSGWIAHAPGVVRGYLVLRCGRHRPEVV